MSGWGGGGVAGFPTSYAGGALKLLQVNAAETGIQFLDPTADWLPQYALLAGRANGQKLIGSLTAGSISDATGDLVFQATANMTPGYVSVSSTNTVGLIAPNIYGGKHNSGNLRLGSSSGPAGTGYVEIFIGGGIAWRFQPSTGKLAANLSDYNGNDFTGGHIDVSIHANTTCFGSMANFSDDAAASAAWMVDAYHCRGWLLATGTSTTNWVSGYGVNGLEVAIVASSTGTNIVISAAQTGGVIRFVTGDGTAAEQARWLKTGNTLQGNAGLTIQGGSGAHTLTLNGGPSANAAVAIASSDGKLGFFAATPVVRPAGYTQNYATADRTLSAYTPDNEGSAYTGIDNLQVGTVYAQVADLNALRVAVENLRAFTEDAAQMLNAVVDDSQGYGLAQ